MHTETEQTLLKLIAVITVFVDTNLVKMDQKENFLKTFARNHYTIFEKIEMLMKPQDITKKNDDRNLTKLIENDF